MTNPFGIVFIRTNLLKQNNGGQTHNHIPGDLFYLV